MESINILIVEDEPKVASFIKKGLEEQSYYVEIAYDGMMGRELALNNKFDLIILDINLPMINGYQLCKEIRTTDASIPIIMLTALGSTDNKLTGFDSGADDYMIKPFEFKELLARIKALLKRSKNSLQQGNVLKIDDLEINIDSKKVKRGSKNIDLTAKEFLLLEYFIRNKNRVISRVDIAEKIWDTTFDSGSNVIDVYVNFLRKKIDADFPKKLIHTRIGLGYVMKDNDD